MTDVTTVSRARPPDEACAQATDVALGAVRDLAGESQPGEHVGVVTEAERVVTHLFAAQNPAYRGWRWAVTVARAARSKSVTVSEIGLIPGPEALLAPPWVPWSVRVRPGDLRPGDLMPAHDDDERLVPAAVLSGQDGLLGWGGDPELPATEPLSEGGYPPNAVAPERARVLSPAGRDAAAQRWYDGDHGPGAALAHAAPAPCATCAFLVPLGGPLGGIFGVCANEYAPDDGRVVSVDHGCGAHSEAARATGKRAPAPVIDETGYDLVDAHGVEISDTVFEGIERDEPLSGAD